MPQPSLGAVKLYSQETLGARPKPLQPFRGTATSQGLNPNSHWLPWPWVIRRTL